MAAVGHDVYISPELALVCPELRAAALATLPEREPDAWLDRMRPLRVDVDASPTASQAAPKLDSDPTPLPIAAFVYAAASATRFAVEAAAIIATIIGLLSVVTFLHS